MLSCSRHWKIPEWAIAEISIVENTSTIKINPKEKDDQQMPVREPRKEEENATRPPLPRFTRETTVQRFARPTMPGIRAILRKWLWPIRLIHSGETKPRSRMDERKSFNF
jgi:hypothetical protein